jgi:hypothetical protein
VLKVAIDPLAGAATCDPLQPTETVTVCVWLGICAVVSVVDPTVPAGVCDANAVVKSTVPPVAAEPVTTRKAELLKLVVSFVHPVGAEVCPKIKTVPAGKEETSDVRAIVPVLSGSVIVRLLFEFGEVMVNVPVPPALPSKAILLIFTPYRISQR